MKLTAIIAAIAAIVALATPALANEYDVSPYTGAIYPRSSSERYDPPSVYYPPRDVWPRGCPLDGPGAFSCDRRERHRPRSEHER